MHSINMQITFCVPKKHLIRKIEVCNYYTSENNRRKISLNFETKFKHSVTTFTHKVHKFIIIILFKYLIKVQNK